MEKMKWVAFSVIFAVCSFALSVNGQTTTSTIEGTVTDSNGAVIAGATVKASGTLLAAERTTTTDQDGFYRLVALPAGTYTLTITQSGFAPKTSTLELTLNRIATFNVQLQVGEKVEQVDVSGNEQLLETNEATVGLTVTPKQITGLPVNGRNYLDLLQLVPGVARQPASRPGGR